MRYLIWMMLSWLCCGCSGAQSVDVGEPAGYLGSTGYAALTLAHGEVTGAVDGEIQADVSVPICLDVGGGLCLSVRVYGLAVGGVDVQGGAEVCAEVRAWGQVLAVRCVGSIPAPDAVEPPL